ncbi:MAG TPA: glucose-6-phosphate isomerase [Mizugakiibacter sp.]
MAADSSIATQLAAHAARLRSLHLRSLLRDETRAPRLRHRLGPLLLDLTRQKLDVAALDALGALAEARDWQAARDAMFRGEAINTSERRAVLHTALRAGGSHLPSPAPATVRAEVAATLERMAHIADAVEAGESAALGLPETITDVVHVGIGGSDLGPRLVVEALAPYHTGRVRCHFLPNVDGDATSALMRRLDPRRTLVLLVSKSFGTQETLLNGRALRTWLIAAHDGDAEAAARHFIAVSANVEAAAAFGVPRNHVLPMWDWVGGRYSLWSAVGLVIALAVGMPRFRELLEGAAHMDDHFRTAPWQDNLPVLLALAGIWNRNALGHPSFAVIAYADRLRELYAHLQQVEMESLGKRVRADGGALADATVPVLWGGVGSNVQHAFFQALHQGTDVVPVDFVGVVRPDHALADNHDALLANLLAQAAALALGKTREEALAEAPAGDTAAREALAAQRTFPGDRPSSVILLDALTAHSLGMLLALYEHKVFVQGHLWGVNAFDQWGVELGKTIASAILPALDGDAAASAAFDPSTRALIEAIQARREAR